MATAREAYHFARSLKARDCNILAKPCSTLVTRLATPSAVKEVCAWVIPFPTFTWVRFHLDTEKLETSTAGPSSFSALDWSSAGKGPRAGKRRWSGGELQVFFLWL